jgi:uncharacterized protein (TIGR02996 family)
MSGLSPFLLRIARRISTGPEDEALLYEVLERFQDLIPRRVYADWLLDRGDPRGEYMHARWEQMLPGVGMTPRWGELERRMLALRPAIDPLWLGFVMWEGLSGTVTRIEDRAFYVNLGDGLVGQVHINDLSW